MSLGVVYHRTYASWSVSLSCECGYGVGSASEAKEPPAMSFEPPEAKGFLGQTMEYAAIGVVSGAVIGMLTGAYGSPPWA